MWFSYTLNFYLLFIFKLCQFLLIPYIRYYFTKASLLSISWNLYKVSNSLTLAFLTIFIIHCLIFKHSNIHYHPYFIILPISIFIFLIIWFPHPYLPINLEVFYHTLIIYSTHIIISLLLIFKQFSLFYRFSLALISSKSFQSIYSYQFQL